MVVVQCDGKRGSIFGKNVRVNPAILGGKIGEQACQEPLAPPDHLHHLRGGGGGGGGGAGG